MQHNDKLLRDRLKRYTDGLYTVSDINSLSYLCHETTLMEEEMEKYWEESALVSTSLPEYEKYRTEAKTLLDTLRKKKRKTMFLALSRYAAVISFFLLSGISLLFYLTEKTGKDEPVSYSELYVPNGERETLILPDGSRITLNSDSYLRYPSHFTGSTRTIEVNGEAFLSVSPDVSKQFIVHTEAVDIKVLGTSFNVKAYAADHQVLVSVCSGKVQIDMTEASMNLKPDEMVILDKNSGELEKRNIDSRRVMSWTDGELYFNKTPIEAVVKDLERYYNCNIYIDNEMLKDEVVYGEHSNESLESVLQSIEYSIGIKNRKEGDRIILYR